MASVIGDSNATLKDLTVLTEDTIKQTRPQLYPLVCSDVKEDGAYTKIPVSANMPWPKKFEAEREPHGKDVTVIQEFDQDTYSLTIDLNSDLVRNAKAYSQADLVKEATMSAKLFPDYLMSQAIINGSSNNGYDGNAYYGSTHKYAKAGTNNINNTISKTGGTVSQLSTDFASANGAIRTFLDNQGRLLNSILFPDQQNYLIHCPVALEQNFRQMLFGSMIPMAAPVTTSGTAAATGSNEVLRGAAGIYADGYLDASSATTWYLHYVSMPQRPFVWIENYGLQVTVLGFGSEFEVNNNKVRIAMKHRFVIGYYRFDRSVKVA